MIYAFTFENRASLIGVYILALCPISHCDEQFCGMVNDRSYRCWKCTVGYEPDASYSHCRREY